MDHSIAIYTDRSYESDISAFLSIETGYENSSSSSSSRTAETSPPAPIPTPSTTTRAKKLSNLLVQMICALSCIAVAIDPLFLYIPIINATKKCIGLDGNVRDAALILRSLIDIPFLILMIGRIRATIRKTETDSDQTHVSFRLLWTDPKTFFKQSYTRVVNFEKLVAGGLPPYTCFSFIIDFLSLLPIPQVAVVVVFFGLKGSRFFNKRSIMNATILFQYLPRIGRIRLYRKEIVVEKYFNRAAFDFYLYMLASHVLGAIWYFFSIQRETTCWHKACESAAACTSYYCHETSTNIALFNVSCSINPPNEVDFGIYLDAIKSGITGPIDFPTKFVYTLWWGFRNMSNFGTNLETSTYLWENCFVILISAIGLLLFLYLIGNIQIYMALATKKSTEAEDEKSVNARKMKPKQKQMLNSKRMDQRLRRKSAIIRELIREWKVAKKLSPGVSI